MKMWILHHFELIYLQDTYTIRYQIGNGSRKQKSTETEKPKEKEKNKDEEYANSLRDHRISWIGKLVIEHSLFIMSMKTTAYQISDSIKLP